MSGRDRMEEYVRRTMRNLQHRGPGGPRGPQMPRGMLAGIIGLGGLLGSAIIIRHSLFNVDGGHRAIKYRRISGVSPDIYNEGSETQVYPSAAELPF